MTWTQELDEAAILATKKGCWHIVLFLLLCGLAAIPTSFLVFSQVFTNATPQHWCAPAPELEGLGLPEELLQNLTVPGEHETYASCKNYLIDKKALYSALLDYIDERSEIQEEAGVIRVVKIQQFIPATHAEDQQLQIQRITEAILALRKKSDGCPHGWKFSREHYERTLVTEFSLVCDKDWLPRTSNTLFWVGSIFGNLFFGWMSDRYGRRPTILLMIFIEIPLTIATSFPNNYWTYIILRVLGGLFFPALYQQPFILALELMPPDKRTYTGIVVGMLFASGMCLLALLAYFIRDWFHLSLATSVPFIFLYGYYWLIPESPRWLVGRGRVADAEKVLRSIARKNGIIIQRGFLIDLHRRIKEEETEGGLARLTSTNNHVPTFQAKEDFTDRRINNILTYKPEIIKKDINIEAIIKKSNNNEIEEVILNDDEVNSSFQQKSTQTEYISPMNNLRRKSIQVMNRILNNDHENALQKKMIDDQNSEGDCKASPLDLFRYPNIRKKFLLLTFNWVALGVVYNSLSYNTSNLGVDDYLAFFIGGAVELPSYIIAWITMERYGRRWVLFTFLALGGVACLSCLFVPEAWPWITVSLAMLGRLCAASSFAVFYVQIGELLPTVVRSQAMGAASFIAGVGLLTCPYIVHLASYSRSLPLIIMGVLSVLAAVTSLFLPETLNQPLPQTLGDGETFGRSFKLLSCVER